MRSFSCVNDRVRIYLGSRKQIEKMYRGLASAEKVRKVQRELNVVQGTISTDVNYLQEQLKYGKND